MATPSPSFRSPSHLQKARPTPSIRIQLGLATIEVDAGFNAALLRDVVQALEGVCALLIHKGALLKDPNGILIQQTENVQAGRQIRFTNVQEIVERAAS